MTILDSAIFKCIFRSPDYITGILLKNGHTTIIRELKNSDPYIYYMSKSWKN